MSGTFVIDCYAKNRVPYASDYAVVAVDVIRATTTATTALYLGRDVYPAATADHAAVVAQSLPDPLLVGEMGGHVPFGFDLTNSPVQITALNIIPSGYFTNTRRPIVLVSSSGTPLIVSAMENEAIYLGCLRNYTAVARHIAGKHARIAMIGAGSRGEFRREDAICCAWIGGILQSLGYAAETTQTAEIVDNWRGADLAVISEGKSARYLHQTGQVHDLEFILHYVDDLKVVPRLNRTHFVDANLERRGQQAGP